MKNQPFMSFVTRTLLLSGGWIGFAFAVYAQEAPAKSTPAAEPSFMGSPFIGLLLMVAVFFFLIILPQSRKAKKHAQFIAALEKGDAVVTNSGLYGKIYGLTDKVITLEIAPNVRIRVDRQSIAGKDPTPGEGNLKVAEGR